MSISWRLREFGESSPRTGTWSTGCSSVEEIEYCSNRKKSYQHFAVRFAAKEAALKALGVGWSDGIRWTDVEVVNRRSGQPTLRLSGRAQELFEAAGACRSLVTLSHGEDYAVAVVVLDA